MIEGGERQLKSMKVGMQEQWVGIPQFSAEVVGNAITGSDLVGDVLDWDVIVRVVEVSYMHGEVWIGCHWFGE